MKNRQMNNNDISLNALSTESHDNEESLSSTAETIRLYRDSAETICAIESIVNSDEGPLSQPSSYFTSLLSDDHIKQTETFSSLSTQPKSKSSINLKVLYPKKDKNFPSPWTCSFCNKTYASRRNLIIHMLAHADLRPHVCGVCNKSFRQVSHLNVHQLTHEKQRNHSCPTCDKKFRQPDHLKRHLSLHSKAVELSKMGCNSMDYDALEESALSKGKSHSCSICGKNFAYSSLLKNHIKTQHSEKKTYSSNQDGANSTCNKLSKSNIKTQTKLNLFKCEICEREFTLKSNLQRHKLIHNKTKFSCSECPKVYSQEQSLKTHMISHNLNKTNNQFQCNTCGKFFFREQNLQAHQHIHSQIKPHVCHCGASFISKGNLNKHRRKHHPTTNEQNISLSEESSPVLHQVDHIHQ